MKQAVAYLQPFIEEKTGGNNTNGKILMATVKATMHDIGKNIVGVVLRAIISKSSTWGVMVHCDEILRVARKRPSISSA